MYQKKKNNIKLNNKRTTNIILSHFFCIKKYFFCNKLSYSIQIHITVELLFSVNSEKSIIARRRNGRMTKKFEVPEKH